MTEEKPAYRWVMLFLLMLISFSVIGLCMAVMPALFDEIRKELGITHGQIGIIWGSAALGTLLTSLVGGTLGDRYGVKRVIGFGIIASSITCALRAILPSFGGLILSMILFGMACGFIQPNIPKAIGMWFGPRELGKALGASMVGVASGFAIALMAGATLSSLIGGWQAVIWLTVAISLGSFIIWMAMARERTGVATDHPRQGVSTIEGLRSILLIRDLWLVALMGLCLGGGAMATIGLLPEILEERGMSSTMAGIYVSISTWTIVGFNLIGPYVSDRVGLRKLFIWPFLLISVSAVTFFGVFTGIALIVMIVLYSIGLGVALPLFRTLIIENERISPLLFGAAFGIIGTVNYIGDMVIPIVMGVIIDVTGKYWLGFLFVAVLFAIAAILAAATKETGLKAKNKD
ncbi:CynX/NimT family MFS transporter [Chloroflexota bacterium]